MILLGSAQCFKKNCDWLIKMPHHIIFAHVVIKTKTLLQFFFPILPLAFLFHLGIPKHILGPCYKCFRHVKVPLEVCYLVPCMLCQPLYKLLGMLHM